MGFDGRLSIRNVQPRSATKAYSCPGCGQTIPAGRFHMVVVPEDEPDLRRHWHHGCWYKEQKRRWGRRRRSGHPSMPLDVHSASTDDHGHQIYPPHAP